MIPGIISKMIDKPNYIFPRIMNSKLWIIDYNDYKIEQKEAKAPIILSNNILNKVRYSYIWAIKLQLIYYATATIKIFSFLNQL